MHAGTIVQNQNGGTGLFTFCEFIMCFLVLLFCHQLNGISLYIFLIQVKRYRRKRVNIFIAEFLA